MANVVAHVTHKNPLGRPGDFPAQYAPDVLFPISRADSRAELLTKPVLPFTGEDIWTAWELSWLDLNGKPVVAVASLRFPADSSNIVESKSLKLYLNSLANMRYASGAKVQALIRKDLSAAADAPVRVDIAAAPAAKYCALTQFPGTCIDDLQIEPGDNRLNVNLLTTDSTNAVSETLYSHLLRSNCPVTNQPDTGSILIRYRGDRIDAESLLKYIVSYRNHNDFHEACVERIFVDIKTRCQPEKLTVYARYNRRGGLDINPFRTDFEDPPGNDRLWRQ